MKSVRVIRNSVRPGIFDVPEGTVGRTIDTGKEKLSVTWSDSSWGVYRRETLDFCEETT